VRAVTVLLVCLWACNPGQRPAPATGGLNAAPYCRPQYFTATTSMAPPRVGGLFPLDKLLRPFRLALVRMSPGDRPLTLPGRFLWARQSIRDEQPRTLRFRGQSATLVQYRVPGSLDVDLRSLRLPVDSIPRAPDDSTLFLATAVIDSSSATMLIAIGDWERPKVLMFVTSSSNGLSGVWFGPEPSDPSSPRGYFCAESY
jgi:hypothetical protein